MKQLAYTFGAFLYLLLSLGIQVNMHYCKGELENVSLVSEGQSCEEPKEEKPLFCCLKKESSGAYAEKMEAHSPNSSCENKGCCSNEVILLKVLDERQIQPAFQWSPLPLTACAYLLDLSPKYTFPEIYPAGKWQPDSGPPPPPEAAWLLHCSPILYG
ncbi:MAG: hypothetical protein AAGI38_00920 [Bacteroidota bacterium]